MYVKQKTSYNGFGWIAETVIGVAQAAALGTASAIQYDKIKKQQKKTKTSLLATQNKALTEQQQLLAEKEKALLSQQETEMWSEQQLKSTVISIIVVAVIASIIGVVAFVKVGTKNE